MKTKEKCPECGISIPKMPEDATYEERLCNECFDIGARRWSSMDSGFLPNDGVFPFDVLTVGVVDEEQGGIVAYFNSQELADEFVKFKNDTQE
jgi:hypothetical protein